MKTTEYSTARGQYGENVVVAHGSFAGEHNSVYLVIKDLEANCAGAYLSALDALLIAADLNKYAVEILNSEVDDG